MDSRLLDYFSVILVAWLNYNYLSHQSSQFKSQDFVEWKHSSDNLLTYLIAKQHLLSLSLSSQAPSIKTFIINQRFVGKNYYFFDLPPKHPVSECESYDSCVLKFSRTFLSESSLPPADDVAHLVTLLQTVINILVKWIITEDAES